MNTDRVRSLLAEVAAGALSVEDAERRLAWAPVEDLGFAKVDHHRTLRQGYPEVIYGEGKTPDHLLEISRCIVARGDGLLATRVSAAAARALTTEVPAAVWNETGRVVHAPAREPAPVHSRGSVLVVSAGTSDLPVAEEAAACATALGNPVERLHDVGVAGIHRVLAAWEALGSAAVVIVVAGMEGALPSVVGGLVAAPVIAVPTSVGYGASLGGLSALLGMLNSCAAGVTVVNIDNGFGAAFAATRINRIRAGGRDHK